MTLIDRILDLVVALRTLINQRGLPAGGTSGQVLAKASALDRAVGWITPQAGGGLGAGQLAVRYDPAQPVVDCLWVAPDGAVILITGS